MTDYLSKGRKASEIDEKTGFFLRALQVGPSKSGKTTAACTMPGPKLIIDGEKRASSIIGFPDTTVLDVLDLASSQSVASGTTFDKVSAMTAVKAWNIFCDINNELWLKASKGEIDPQQTTIVDSLTALNHFSMMFLLSLNKSDGTPSEKGLGGGPAQAHYPGQMIQMMQLIISMRGLPCHIIFNGHLDLFEDKKTGELRYLPYMYGKTRGQVGSWFDETYETERKTDPVTRKVSYFWNTAGSGQKDFIGSSLNRQGKLWTSPFEINLNENPCGFAKILKLRFGEKGGAT